MQCLASTHAPILWSLHLFLERDKRRKPLRVFEGECPSLTHVYLDGMSLAHCRPPLSSITTLHLNRRRWSNNWRKCRELSNILSAVPSLVHLELKDATRWPSEVSICLPYASHDWILFKKMKECIIDCSPSKIANREQKNKRQDVMKGGVCNDE